MFGRRGGVRVWVRHMNFSAFWGSNSRALGLKNSSHLIKYPFLRLTKPQFGAKFVTEIPREGTEEVFKCDTYASKPTSPPPPPPPRAEDDGKTAERKRRGVSFAPALLSY